MKINSEKLWDYIFNLATDEKVKFKVYFDDAYLTEIFWDGENFNWESGTFTSGAFFNPLYDFEVIEEEKELEILENFEKYPTIPKNEFETELMKYIGIHRIKINELVREVNKLKKDTKNNL